MYKVVACIVQLHTSYRLPGMLAGQWDVLPFRKLSCDLP